jgi:hypothetical protein
MIDNYLVSLNACEDAREWAKGKSWEEIFDTCHRGDWLLWLYRMQEDFDLRKLILAKGHCANTVRHLMKDERSINAVDTAIKYGEGKCELDELNKADAAAADAAYAYAAYAARKENQQLTADICRQYLPFEIWNIKED